MGLYDFALRVASSIVDIDIDIDANVVARLKGTACFDNGTLTISDTYSKAIKAGAFRDMSDIKVLNLLGIKVIEFGAFEGCTNLAEVYINKPFAEVQKMVSNIPKDAVVCYSEKKNDKYLIYDRNYNLACLDPKGEEIVVPEGVTVLKKKMLSGVEDTEAFRITIPYTVENIEDDLHLSERLKIVSMQKKYDFVQGHLGICPFDALVFFGGVGSGENCGIIWRNYSYEEFIKLCDNNYVQLYLLDSCWLKAAELEELGKFSIEEIRTMLLTVIRKKVINAQNNVKKEGEKYRIDQRITFVDKMIDQLSNLSNETIPDIKNEYNII